MPKPLVAIDGYNLALEQGTGVATYARNLSHRLSSLGAEVAVLYAQRMARARDAALQEVTFFDPRPPAPLAGFGRLLADLRGMARVRQGVEAWPVPLADRVIRQPMEARMPRADRFWTVPDLYRASTILHGYTKRFGKVTAPTPPALMHWTFPLPVRMPGVPNIYTIHDLVPLRLPYTTLDHKRRHYTMLRRIAREADHIVTVSECSRRDICSLLDVPEERVTNTYQAVDLPPKLVAKPEAMARAEVAGAFGLGWGDYFLYFGAIEPKKNVGRMIEGFLASGSSRKLVICGRQAWQSLQELGLLYEDDRREFIPFAPPDGAHSMVRRLRDRVQLVDYVPFRLLVSLVRGARALLFPSLYEGFGLPVLEAMHLGTPVVTANTAALPEVAGDAALLVDPYDTRAMAEAIGALDRDDALRAEYAARGPKRAALFDNAAYERRLIEMYRRLGVAL